MKYVTRQAPPPPIGIAALKQAPQMQQQQQQFSVQPNTNKPKPPRPPPPRVDTKPAAAKDQSMKIFSNLFGASKKNGSSNKLNEKLSTQMEVKLPPPRLPMPAINNRHHQNQHNSSTTPVQQLRGDVQLINFEESPPASPVGFIKKSNTGGSDSVSIDSFCSTNSSPNNLGFNSGTTSQAER